MTEETSSHAKGENSRSCSTGGTETGTTGTATTKRNETETETTETAIETTETGIATIATMITGEAKIEITGTNQEPTTENLARSTMIVTKREAERRKSPNARRALKAMSPKENKESHLLNKVLIIAKKIKETSRISATMTADVLKEKPLQDKTKIEFDPRK